MGQAHGLTAVEMNILLKEEGFLEGEPGRYVVTAKGKLFANEALHGRGTGGSLQYNPSWVQTTWDPSIEGEFDITDERRQQLREAASATRQQGAASRAAQACGFDDGEGDQGETNDFGLDPLKVVAGLAIAAISIYGIWVVAPHVKSLWTDKAAPGLKRLKNRARGRPEPHAETADGDDDAST